MEEPEEEQSALFATEPEVHTSGYSSVQFDIEPVIPSKPAVYTDDSKTDFSERNLIHFTDFRLTTKPPAFNFQEPNYLDFAPTPAAFAEAMFQKMLDMGGVGLSANQIGIPLRVFVFGNHVHRHYVFNPEVVGVSPETVLMEERCLSFPGFKLNLVRPKVCGVTYQTETGEQKVATFDNIAARVFLHEQDHMEGITFLNWASKFKIDWELQKVTKRLKKFNRQQKRKNGEAR
jgi:peptide deformylase